MNRVLSPESKFIRAFVAIQLPEDVRAVLRAAQAELKEVLPRNSTAWTRPANMHLTLRFLGGVESARLPELQLKLREALAGFGPLDLICERLGCFPDLRFPRVVWAWVHDAEERLAQLHRRVDSAVAGFAEKPAEARFTGHVNAERLAGFVERAVERKFGDWSCREVELIRSELSPGGSQYSTIEVFHL